MALCYGVRWLFGSPGMAIDLELLAHHEAGHAAVAWALGVRLVWVEIDPSRDKGATRTEGTTTMRSALIRLAGGRAESILDPTAPSWRLGAIEDEVLLREALENRILRGSANLDEEELNRRRDIVDGRLAERCLRLVRLHWPAIQRLAAALVERNEIEGAEAESILAASATEASR